MNSNIDKDIKNIFKRFNRITNMSLQELRIWNRNPASKKASLSRTPINRVIRLKSKLLNNWTLRDVRDANKVISYISRAKKIKTYRPRKARLVKGTKLTKNEIALRNWGFDRFK